MSPLGLGIDRSFTQSAVSVRVSGSFIADDSSAVHLAALGGHGIAYLPQIEVFDDLRAGNLVSVFSDYPSPPVQVSLVYSSRRIWRRGQVWFWISCSTESARPRRWSREQTYPETAWARAAVVMSGRGTIAMAVSAIKLGAVDSIEKPFRGPEMAARVTEAIGSHVDRRAGGGTPSFGPPHLPGSRPSKL